METKIELFGIDTCVGCKFDVAIGEADINRPCAACKRYYDHNRDCYEAAPAPFPQLPGEISAEDLRDTPSFQRSDELLAENINQIRAVVSALVAAGR